MIRPPARRESRVRRTVWSAVVHDLEGTIRVRGRSARLSAAVLGAAALAVLSAGLASAHPLGNFTINHYAGLRVGVDAIRLDVVVDMA